jgi:hypothetical protein
VPKQSTFGNEICPVLVPVHCRPAFFTTKENEMGKYFLGWLLGVPVVVLVVAYFYFG